MPDVYFKHGRSYKTYVKMMPSSQKPWPPSAKLPLLPHQTDHRTRPKTAIRFVAFVTKVAPQVVCIVHLHIFSLNMYECI